MVGCVYAVAIIVMPNCLQINKPGYCCLGIDDNSKFLLTFKARYYQIAIRKT